jgi:hypothetical protein
MELLDYHSNLNTLSVLDNESPTTKSRREKGGFVRPLEPVPGESHQGLLDWHLRRSCDVHVHLEFGDRFPIGKVAARDLFVLVYLRGQIVIVAGPSIEYFRFPSPEPEAVCHVSIARTPVSSGVLRYYLSGCLILITAFAY